MTDPTVTTVAALIADVGPYGFPLYSVGSAAGQLLAGASERVVGSNSVIESAGVLYVVILEGTGSPLVYGFQVYKSADFGATWSTSGAPLIPTDFGGGLNVLQVGTGIYAAYSNQQRFATTPSAFLTLAVYDTLTETWGAEDRFDCGPSPVGGDFRVEGPYDGKIRSDGSIVYLLSDTLSGYPHAVVYDIGSASWFAPFQLSSVTESFESAVLVSSDDHVYVMCTDGAAPDFRLLGIDNANIVDTPSPITYTGQALNWNGFGIEYGFEDAGFFYFACGRKTGSYPTIWGRTAIFYGDPVGGWTLGPELDLAADADLSVYSSSLIRRDDTLLYFWRGVTSDGLSYVERLGWAPVGSHASPLDWTWVQFYDFSSPSPAVSGQTSPYETYAAAGMAAGITIDNENRLHFVTTLKGADGELFVVYLAGITLDEFGNQFFFGGAYYAQ